MKLTKAQYFVLVDFDAAAGKRMAGRDLTVIRRLSLKGHLKWISGVGKFSIWSAIAVLVIALIAVAWVLAR